MRLRRNNSLVSFIISQSHVKWEVFFNLFFTRQGCMATIEIILDVVQIIVSTGIIVVLLKDRKCK